MLADAYISSLEYRPVPLSAWLKWSAEMDAS